ncbi:armadillo repeat-containing protein 4 [Carica papaya]|uniref:armadillo repeat-containing protein 4 n=1 Tax=Carica papaya TaxID=3649 RepID=UPI000B8CA1EE|nr:armadillo repeat-containing protein 4 [Carica papaya]
MGHSDSEKNRENLIPDWEKAFEHYEQVMVFGTEAMRLKATVKFAHISNQAPGDVLARTIPILADLLAGGNSDNLNQSIQEASAYCLKRIACSGQGRLAREIGQSGALHSILRLLPLSGNGFQRLLVKCLWSLVTFAKANRLIVARNGGLEIVINMLNLNRDGTRRYLLEILSALTLSTEVRMVLINFGGLRFLVEAASCGSIVSRERACRAIGLLGVARRARRMLVELGVIEVLVELFRVGDNSTKLLVGNSLGVISAHVDYIRPVAEAGAIPLYAELLLGPEPIGKEIAEDVFCILAVAEGNAVSIADQLVRILREGDDAAKAAASDVFWDLSSYKHSTPVVRNSGAIPILVEILQDESIEVREKASGAIAQLSYNEGDRVALSDAGAVPILLEMLHDESEELRDNAAEALISFSEDPEQRERILESIDLPSFQSMQNRLVRNRASDELMVRSVRRMSIQQLSWNPEIL